MIGEGRGQKRTLDVLAELTTSFLCAAVHIHVLPSAHLLLPNPVFFARVAELVDFVLSETAATVALFRPRIAAHVIAVLLPEARQVIRQELEAAHPLRALPEIQMRYQ